MLFVLAGINKKVTNLSCSPAVDRPANSHPLNHKTPNIPPCTKIISPTAIIILHTANQISCIINLVYQTSICISCTAIIISPTVNLICPTAIIIFSIANLICPTATIIFHTVNLVYTITACIYHLHSHKTPIPNIL